MNVSRYPFTDASKKASHMGYRNTALRCTKIPEPCTRSGGGKYVSVNSSPGKLQHRRVLTAQLCAEPFLCQHDRHTRAAGSLQVLYEKNTRYLTKQASFASVLSTPGQIACTRAHATSHLTRLNGAEVVEEATERSRPRGRAGGWTTTSTGTTQA